MVAERSNIYARPANLRDAVALIGNPDVCVLAGGTDLVIMRAEGLVEADRLVDIKGIAELEGITTGEAETVIGACTRLDDIAGSTSLTPDAVSDGAALVGSWQTRCRATIGGNVCRASPAADTLCGLLVRRARLELVSAAETRSVPAQDFFVGPGKTLMRPDQLLTRIVIPHQRGGSAYQRFTYRNAMDLAVAGVAVFVELDKGRCIDARVAIGACGPKPLLVPAAAAALIGSDIGESAMAKAAEAVIAAATPIDDVRGTRKHRLHVLKPLTHRVVGVAVARAMTEGRAAWT